MQKTNIETSASVDITISNQPHPMEYLQASEELDATEQLNK